MTRSALAIPIVCISFMLFKGPSNILNALFVPLTIFVFTFNSNRKESIAFYIAIILFCAAFFGIQIFFISMYCVIAHSLIIVHKRRMKPFVAFPMLTFVVGFCFWLGILATDFIFYTEINQIMMKILHNNALYYFGMLAIEAGLVSFLLYGLSNIFLKRTMGVPSKH